MSNSVVVLVVLGLCACHGTESRQRAAAGSAAAVDPWAARDAAPAVPDTPATRKARAEAALGRVAAIMPKLAKLRDLTFEHDIPREYQSTEDFRAFVHAEIAKELPPAKASDMSAALYQLGLLPKPANLAQLEEQAFVTQAGAYYDPKTKKFFLVMVPDNDIMLDTMSAHELTHGLQDQHFDLEKFLPEDGSGAQAPKLDDDAESARRFVAEGDATFTMFLYTAAQIGGGVEIQPQMLAVLKQQLATFAAMSPEEMAKMNAPGAMSTDPDIKKSIDAMADIPLTVLVPMIDSYMQGALLVMAAYDRGGWPAVDDLYVHPPESTEQALHPEKLYPTRDHPHRVTLPALPGTTELATVVFGELQWQVYFSLWVPQMKAAASEGWGGNQASVARRADGRLVARVATVWDTPGDAAEFAQAYKDSLIKRFHGDHGDPASAAGFARPDGAGKIFLQHKGLEVFVVDGADDRKALDALVAGTRFD